MIICIDTDITIGFDQSEYSVKKEDGNFSVCVFMKGMLGKVATATMTSKRTTEFGKHNNKMVGLE